MYLRDAALLRNFNLIQTGGRCVCLRCDRGFDLSEAFRATYLLKSVFFEEDIFGSKQEWF